MLVLNFDERERPVFHSASNRAAICGKLAAVRQFHIDCFPNRHAGRNIMSTPSLSTPSRGFCDGVDKTVTVLTYFGYNLCIDPEG